MSGVHCELFPECWEIGADASVPICTSRPDCPGVKAQKFSEAFARAVTHMPRPQTPEEDEIENMRAYLWAAGIGAGDAEFAAQQLYRQGFRIVKVALAEGRDD
jgi:hypothetical protein